MILSPALSLVVAALCTGLFASGCAAAARTASSASVELRAAGAPSVCGVDNVTLMSWGASPNTAYAVRMLDNTTTVWGLSPCTTYAFDDKATLARCDRAVEVNIEQYAADGTTCSRGFVVASAPSPSYEPISKRLRLYFDELGNATVHLDLLVDCDPAATMPVPVSGAAVGPSYIIRFNSSAVCSSAASPTPSGPPLPPGATTSHAPTGPPSDAPSSTPTSSPRPGPREEPDKEPVAASVIVGAVILGLTFIFVIVILRRWAVQSRKEARVTGEYVGVARR